MRGAELARKQTTRPFTEQTRTFSAGFFANFPGIFTQALARPVELQAGVGPTTENLESRRSGGEGARFERAPEISMFTDAPKIPASFFHFGDFIMCACASWRINSGRRSLFFHMAGLNLETDNAVRVHGSMWRNYGAIVRGRGLIARK